MKENQLQIVTFEQAQRLKEAGFDWDVEAYYSYGVLCRAKNVWTYHNFNDNCYSIDEVGVMSAPTVALALKWARDVKGMRTGVMWSIESCGFEWNGQGKFIGLREVYTTYESAESAFLDALLDEIEERGA